MLWRPRETTAALESVRGCPDERVASAFLLLLLVCYMSLARLYRELAYGRLPTRRGLLRVVSLWS